jgi:predicted hydrocarbon binding protein
MLRRPNLPTTMAESHTQDGVVGIGIKALHVTRQALIQDLGEAGEARLQEIGYAAGEEIYQRFCRWLPDFAGVSDPGELDAAALTEVLSAFFQTLGWGPVTVERVGRTGLAATSTAWAEVQPGVQTEYPSCFFSTGLFASFFTCLAGATVATMELECRTQGDPRCRFLAGSPEVLDAVYEAMSQGREYESILGG